MLIKQHQSNTISLSLVIGLEKGAVCLTRRVEVKLSINSEAPSTRIWSFFESATFSFGIRPPSTRFRWIRHTDPQLFESALQSANFWIRYESGIVWTPNSDFFLSGDVTRSSPVWTSSFTVHDTKIGMLSRWKLIFSSITISSIRRYVYVHVC